MSAAPLPRLSRLALLGLAALLLGGCASKPKAPREPVPWASRPASLLVLPPLNESRDVKAPWGVLAQVTAPLAEAGYYVLPVAVVAQTLRDNGMTVANDIHAISHGKLREIFGADAVVYLRVREYGSVYAVIESEALVTVDARIVDLRSGRELWAGSATASSTEGRDRSNLAVMIVQAVFEQIINVATDASYKVAARANQRLLGLNPLTGVQAGPRLPPPPPRN
jgi:hypothetical protein